MRWVSLLSLLLASACARETLPPPPYNVVLISVDTLRADRLNCYGYDEYRVSPNMDALAADGVLFETHISPSPWTTPAHMSLVTSLHPSGHGLTETFSDTMAGIRKGTFNKLPEERLTLAEALRNRGYATAAFTGGITLDPAIGFDQGFDLYDTSMYKLNADNVDAMLEWIRHYSGRPFFLFWHTFEVHAPYLHGEFLPAEYKELAPELEELAQSLSRIESHSQNAKALESFLRERDAFVPEVCESLYVSGIKSMDRWLGRFIEALRTHGLYNRTVIVLTSDHGDEFADHDPELFYNKHGHSAYEEMIRVPLILKLPGQRHAGTTVETVSRGIDVMPTILDVVDVELDGDEIHGSSLRSLWEEHSSERERIAFTESTATGPEIKSLRTGRWKYIVEISPKNYADKGRTFIPEQPSSLKLFDLEGDPMERINLAESGGAPETEIASSLERRLRALMAAGRGETEELELDEDMLEELRALGYVK